MIKKECRQGFFRGSLNKKTDVITDDTGVRNVLRLLRNVAQDALHDHAARLLL